MPQFCMCAPLSPACRGDQEEGSIRITVNSSESVPPSNMNHNARQTMKKHPAVVTLYRQVHLSNISEGTEWDHLPQNGKTYASITTSKHIIPAQCCYTSALNDTLRWYWTFHTKYSIFWMEYLRITDSNSLKKFAHLTMKCILLHSLAIKYY